MDSRVVQSNVHEDNEHHHPHNVGSQQVAYGAENQHHHDHEKKSVLKKVKEKARKIKDTIKRHGHHDHDHEYHYEYQHIRRDHDLNEEIDEQEVAPEDPEVHGAPTYDSATVEGTILGQPRVDFENTKVVEEEHHQEPRIVLVSATTESDQNRATEAANTLDEKEEKTGQGMVNLERPVELEEDPHAPGSRPEAYTPSNYETKVTDPTGASTGEIDIAPVQESLARMNVQDEAKASPESRVLPTGHPSTEIKTQYSYNKSHDQFDPDLTPTIPKKVSDDIEAKPKVLSSGVDTQYPSVGSHGQYVPDMSSSSQKTEYPSVGSHDQFVPEPIPTNPNKFPENLQAEPEVLPVADDIQHLSVKSHDHVLPDMSASAKTQYPSAEISNETPKVLPAAFLPEVSIANETRYPSTGSHDQFDPEFISAELQENPKVSGEILNTTTRALEQPHDESTEKPSNQNSYAEKISSATSAISDKAVSAKITVASKPGYDEAGDGDEDENEIRHEEYRGGEKPSNQSSYTEKISSATSAIADKAVSAKNAVASKLGYDEKGDRHENETRQEEYRSEEKPSNQSSYTEKISSAASALADKAVSAKDVVASKLGYDEKGDRDENETRQEECRSEGKPSNQSSYTGKLSSAAIADKAVSAKNVVASKLGYDENGDRDERELRQEEYRNEEKPSKQSSYPGEISSAASAIADKVVASKLDYDEKGDRDESELRQEEYRNEEKPSNQSSYPEEISSAASAIADKAVSSKNVVASNLGNDEKGDRDENETKQEECRSGEKPSNESSYTEKISSATPAIADKALSVETAAASKLGYDEKGDREENETRHEEYGIEEKPLNQSSYLELISSATSAIADKAVSAKNAVASELGCDEKGDRAENKTRHEEYRIEEKPLNSAIADKAVSAKNVVASKLGYGETGDMNDKETASEVRERGDAPTVTESRAEYGQKIAVSLTEELAPVYGKVNGAESTAISKVPETRARASDVTTKYETESGVAVQDKGVSVKDYLAEMLRPSDEDMALREVISDTLQKQKEKLTKGTVVDEDRTVSEVVSDAIQKQEEPKKAEHQHFGKVTGSDKGCEEESYMNSPRKGVVDKLKDVVGSWFGKPGDSQSSQVAGGEGLPKNIDGETAHVGQRVEERRLQESTN